MNISDFFKNTKSGVDGVLSNINSLLGGNNETEKKNPGQVLEDFRSYLPMYETKPIVKQEPLNMFSDVKNKYPEFFNPSNNVPNTLAEPFKFGNQKIDSSLQDDYLEKKKVQNLLDEGIISSGDIDPISGKMIKDDDIDISRKIVSLVQDTTAGMLRTFFSPVDFLSKKVVNTSADILGEKRPEMKSSIGTIIRGLDKINPDLGEKSREFFGVKKGHEDVTLTTTGEEGRQIVNLIPGVNIAPDSKAIPLIGGIMSILDWTPAGTGENILRTTLRNVKNTDELVDVIKVMNKSADITDDEALHFANNLLEAKKRKASAFEIDDIIKKENASNSKINIDINIDKKAYENQLKERVRNVEKQIVDEPKVKKTTQEVFDETSKLHKRGLISNESFDVVNQSKNISDDADKFLSKTFDDINKVDKTGNTILDEQIKLFKNKYNQKIFSDLNIEERKGILNFMRKNADLIDNTKKSGLDTKNYRELVENGIESSYKDIMTDLERVQKDFIGTAQNKVNNISESFKLGKTGETLDNIADTVLLKKASSGFLKLWDDIKPKGKTNEVLDRISNIYRSMIKEGKSLDEIKKAFLKVEKKTGRTIDEFTHSDLNDVILNNTSLGSKILNLINRFRYTNVLSNPATHVVNTVVNTVDNIAVNPSMDVIEATTDLFGITKSGKTYSGIASYFKNIFNRKSLLRAHNRAVDSLLNKKGAFHLQDPSTAEAKLMLGNVDIAKWYTTPLSVLKYADAFAFDMVKEAKLSQSLTDKGLLSLSDIRNGVTSDSILKKMRATDAEKILDDVKDIAEDSIFRHTKKKEGEGIATYGFKSLAEGLNKLNKVTKGLSSLPILFVNTLSVLAKKRLKFTPVLGAISDILTPSMKLVSGEARSRILAEQILGTGVLIAGYKYYKAGNNKERFKFNRENPNATSTSYADVEGNPYNTLKIGGKWYNISEFSNIGPNFMLGAKMAQLYDDFDLTPDDKEYFAGIVEIAQALGSSHLRELFNNEFMQPSFDFVNQVSGNSNKSNVAYLGQVAQQFSPYKSIMGAINRLYADNRKTITPESWDEFTNYVFKDFIDIKKLTEDGEFKFRSERIPQKTDRDGKPLFYGNPDNQGKSTIERILSPENLYDITIPGRPKYRDEDIHKKYLNSLRSEEFRNKSKEDRDYTKIEKARQYKIVEDMVKNGANSLSTEDKKLLKSLSPARKNELERDYLNNNKDTASRYIDDYISGDISEEGRAYLKSLSSQAKKEAMSKWETRTYADVKNIVYIWKTTGKLSDKSRKFLRMVKEVKPDILYKAENYYKKTYK